MAMEPYAAVEVWERLKSFILEGDHTLADSIKDRHEADWTVLSTSEAQVLAIMAALEMDLASPADRRRARRLLGTLAAEAEGELLVAEEENSPVVQPSEAERLRKSLRWIASNPPSRFFSSVAGPQAAIREIQHGAPALRSLAAYRWVVAMGYPCAVPDPGRRRWLERFGLVETTTRGQSRSAIQRQTLAVLEEFAQTVHAPLSEVDAVLEAFAKTCRDGVSAVALCGKNPRCEMCPLRQQCTYPARKSQSTTPNRHLSAIMREESRPRERLTKLGAAALTEEELLAIILRTGSGGNNAVDVAAKLMSEAGTLERLAAMTITELAAIKGIGRVKAITIQAALELARRLSSTEIKERPLATGSRQIYRVVENHFVGRKREEFVALLLDVRYRVIRIVPISIGTLTQSLVHPREAFKDAVRESAYAVVFVHNHPTGDPTPSTPDEVITQRLVKAGEVMGIRVLDHLIIGKKDYYSFADAGKIPR
jgi:DNA repair protein RadC